MRSRLVKALSELDAVAIESPLTGIGIPDVNYIGGWIECKYLGRWPRGADTRPVRFPHDLSKAQGIWLWRRARMGGGALLACQVAREWFFYEGLTARTHFNKLTRPQMRDRAALHLHSLDRARLVSFLRARSSS